MKPRRALSPRARAPVQGPRAPPSVERVLPALLAWATQLSYLMFFTALVLVFILLLNYLILVQVNPQIEQALPLYAMVLALTAFGVVLAVSIYFKKQGLDRALGGR